MNLKLVSQLFSFRDLRNAVLGVIVVFGGLGLAALTLYAHRIGDVRLTAVAASASLVFVLLIVIFIVPPLARNAGREASQMNLPFEFTTGGAILLALIVIVGFSAWTTGNNLLFLVLSFLLASMVVAFFTGSLSLKRLDVTMRFPETIFAGEKTPILVTIHNRRRVVPALSIIVEVRGRERERSVAADHLDAIFPKWISKRLGRGPLVRRTLNHFVYVGARRSVEERSSHVFPNRGRLMIRDFELSTRFPFGFFRHRRRLPAREAELIVFPRIDELPAHAEALPLEAGKQVAFRRGGGQDLLALRTYQPQDDLRKIDWKATARTRQLTVREFAADDERRITVIFDPRIDDQASAPASIREKIDAEQSGKPVVISERFEKGASITASLLMQFHTDNAETRLVIGHEVGPFGIGRAHVFECLKRLALADTSVVGRPDLEPPADLERILTERGASHCILVTSNDTGFVASDGSQPLKIIDF